MLLQRLAGAAPSLVWLLLLCPVERTFAKPKKKEKEVDKIALPHHSFNVPIAFEEFLNDWSVSGASLVERERLLVHPSVLERAGFVWSKAPLLTNDFEATLHFRVVGPKGMEKTVSDQSFAIWYVYDNVTAGYNETAMVKAPSWKAGLEEFGMTLSGAKAKFNGFGAILSMSDSQSGTLKSSVSGISNDGGSELSYGNGGNVPASNAKVVDFRNTLNAARFKLRVTPTSVEGHLKLSQSLSWNECFKIDRTKNPVEAGGYIGFSAWSGTQTWAPGAEPAKVSDLVSFSQLEVHNFDTTVVGEDISKDVSKDIQEAYREMLIDDNRHFSDQKSQSDHLTRLTRMLIQHVDTSKPADELMFQELYRLKQRVGKLDEDCKTLTKELQVLVNPDGSKGKGAKAGGHGEIKDSIIGLRRLLTTDGEKHTQKLEMVQKKMTEVKQKHIDASKPEMFADVVGHGEKLQATVKSSSSQTTWMLLAIVFAIVLIGGLMWNRMTYYERKHFL